MSPTCRARVLETIASGEGPRDARTARLLEQGFVYGMAVQHEHQHDETMLATLQLMDCFEHPHADGEAIPATSRKTTTPPSEARVEGGQYRIGTDHDAWAYDNERPVHTVEVEPFCIDTTPVTNAAYRGFVADGGYDDKRHWTAAGWAWKQEAGLVAPQFWHDEGAREWSRLRFGRSEALPDDEPVQHVCAHEAHAYARWAGRRLPTETEWEVAAIGADPHAASPEAGPDLWHESRRWGPRPVATAPDNASHWGVLDLFGGVWEWTSSTFNGYPGFGAFPYREYSEVFFGREYQVLRGGSWATDPAAMRRTFRNWDFPVRRQIFAGFRCARDA